ncbi:MAG: hypothetical protein ACTSQS_18300 [Promethearchaeota archaeon]
MSFLKELEVIDYYRYGLNDVIEFRHKDKLYICDMPLFVREIPQRKVFEYIFYDWEFDCFMCVDLKRQIDISKNGNCWLYTLYSFYEYGEYDDLSEKEIKEIEEYGEVDWYFYRNIKSVDYFENNECALRVILESNKCKFYGNWTDER